MKNLEFLEILKKGDNVLIYNRETNGSLMITPYMYEAVQDATSIEDIKRIANEYDEAGQEYFTVLLKHLEEQCIFERRIPDGIDMMSFAITDKCNLYCTHCCYSANLYKPAVDGRITADMEVVKQVVQLKPRGLSITGGEPLLVANLDEVLAYFKENFHGILGLATNATKITEENAAKLIDSFSIFDISIDGINEVGCDAIRGKGTYKRVMEAIKVLQAHGADKIILSMVVDNETEKYTDDFIQMCKDMGVEPKIRGISLIGRAKDNHSTDSESVIHFTSGSLTNIYSAYDCPGGTSELFVDHQGNVYPCPMFNESQYQIGTVFDHDLSDKMKWDKSLPWFRAFSEYIPNQREECADGDVKAFCWNCPSLAKAYLDNNNLTSFKGVCGQKYQQIVSAIRDA